MFGKRFTLFRLFGFEIRADLSWLVIAVLVTWSLASGAFPYYFGNLGPVAWWTMGVAGALGLFASIILHELAHSLVARRSGLEVGGITLWIFGGVSETSDEPGDPRTELKVAIVGPLTSLVLGGVFWGLELAGGALGVTEAVTGVLGYLALINVILAAFNMIPAFPLDGGRVFRAFLWGRRDDLLSATRTASRVGSGFGVALMVLGAFSFFTGNFIGGVWWVLIGLFVRGAARSSYQQLLTTRALAAAPVRRIMERPPAPVADDTSLARFVDEYVYASGSQLIPVSRDARLVGYVDVDRVRTIPQGEWAAHTVAELTEQLSEESTIDPESDAAEALKRLQAGGRRSLLVTEDGEVEGVVSLDDLRRYLAWRTQLEQETRHP